MRRQLTDREFVDWVRVKIGLRPIEFCVRSVDMRAEHPNDAYVSAERLQRQALPGCKTCGGSGYFDGWIVGERCACTRRQPTLHAE